MDKVNAVIAKINSLLDEGSPPTESFDSVGADMYTFNTDLATFKVDVAQDYTWKPQEFDTP